MTQSSYLEPRYRFREAAVAAGFSLNTLRSNYQRGWFRSFASGLGTGQGRAQRLCLGDILVLAIANRLIGIGIHPVEAFNAAFPFGVTAKSPKGLGRRKPFELFSRDEFQTLFAWSRGEAPKVIPVSTGQGIPATELGLDEEFGDPIIAFLLNPIEEAVFKQLGLPVPEQLSGS